MDKIENIYYLTLDSLVAQTVKNLPAMQKAQVQTVDGENAPENRMDIHSSILAWRIPWTEETGWLESRVAESGTQLSD